MKKLWFLSLAVILLTFLTFSIYLFVNKQSFISPLGREIQKPKPLLAYTFESLKNTRFPQSAIALGRTVDETPDSLSQMFYFSVPKYPNSNTTETVSGLLNIPTTPGTYPVVVMFRGFVSKEIYKPGIGTQPAAKLFAKSGFITLAPDFLGYGESASPSADPFEERFQTYTTALTLLSSIPVLNIGLEASYSGKIQADIGKIGIWGHSNGGQIALSVLSISGAKYPSVLWAPVSKSFPYSILYYTDEFDDQGKLLRKALNKFEEDYDVERFSPPNYYHFIKSPIQIDQGTNDHEVPVWWSDELVDLLKKNSIDVSYTTYEGADHNLLPDGWSRAVANSISFFKKHF